LHALADNAYHNLESIGIQGKAEKLVTYAYKNGNGRLKSITYANGHVMRATYNSIGQMVAEKWYANASATTPVAHYKYVYDGAGNIVRSIDILQKKEYTYTYENGKIVRAAESDITLDTNETITGKALVNSIVYSYDQDDKLAKKRIIPANGAEQTIWYENPEDGSPVVKFNAGGKTVTSHSKTDSFGRKEFDELQLGTGFVSRQFHYHAGEVTDEHREAGKLKSTATTQLVSQIVLSDGRTISYDYDSEERITKVTDSVDGITEYTYDALGQLLTEKHKAISDDVFVTVNEMTYDNYGNIVSKNGKAYTYGNSTWKDLLTSYDGQTISYDAQGNPTSYLGHTLTWEKGRQLKSFDNIQYTYNANGIRTSKTVNGVKHEYTLDGAKILKETWESNTIVPLYDNEDSVCGIQFNDEPYYFLKNLQGDIIAIADKNAQVIAKYSYDAWGVCSIEQDTSACNIATVNPYRYRGYYYDEETGLYYLQSRYYNPIVGRFVNADDAEYLNAIDNPVTFNLFFYCNNIPISHADFNGELLTAILVGIAIGAIVGGLAGYGLSRILNVPKGSRWKYVLGGAVIGAIIGGCIGYAVGAAGSSGIVLWSGGGMNGAGGHAMNFAAKNGLRTLEMTTKGKLLSKLNTAAIKILGKSKGYSFMKPLWNAASRQFVKSAAGRQVYVNVFISASQFSEASVFAKIEYEIVRSLGMKIIWHFVQ